MDFISLNIFWDLPAYLFVVLLVFTIIIIVDKIKLRKARYYRKSPALVVFAKDLFWVVLVVFILRAFVIEPFKIPSGSMLPNLLIGDFVLVNKSSYGLNIPLFNHQVIRFNNVKRGDVIVFRFPKDPSIPFIKRVIGVPGDQVSYRDKTLYINGIEIKNLKQSYYQGMNFLFDEYLNQDSISILKEEKEVGNLSPNVSLLENGIKVPRGQYFVMGDNRDNSNDSRYWGFVPESHILGKAILVWANITTDGSLLTLSLDEFLKFFKTFDLNFNSVGRIKTGREE